MLEVRLQVLSTNSYSSGVHMGGQDPPPPFPSHSGQHAFLVSAGAGDVRGRHPTGLPQSIMDCEQSEHPFSNKPLVSQKRFATGAYTSIASEAASCFANDCHSSMHMPGLYCMYGILFDR